MRTKTFEIQPFQPPASVDQAEIRRIVDEYYGAWFDADPDRMASVLHPELAKRGWVANADGERIVDADTAETMLQWTRRGVGRTDDQAAREIDIRVVEIYDDIATALVHTPRCIETLQLIRTPDGWQILNALWRTP